MYVFVCVCVLPGSFRGLGAFYFKIENRRDILNTTLLLTRITAHKQSLTESKHKHHIQLLGNNANELTTTGIKLYNYLWLKNAVSLT